MGESDAVVYLNLSFIELSTGFAEFVLIMATAADSDSSLLLTSLSSVVDATFDFPRSDSLLLSSLSHCKILLLLLFEHAPSSATWIFGGGVGEKRWRLLFILFRLAVKSLKSNLAERRESPDDVLFTWTDWYPSASAMCRKPSSRMSLLEMSSSWRW